MTFFKYFHTVPIRIRKCSVVTDLWMWSYWNIQIQQCWKPTEIHQERFQSYCNSSSSSFVPMSPCLQSPVHSSDCFALLTPRGTAALLKKLPQCSVNKSKAVHMQKIPPRTCCYRRITIRNITHATPMFSSRSSLIYISSARATKQTNRHSYKTRNWHETMPFLNVRNWDVMRSELICS
jgi:hypothetical protein